jgi:hypothetical protein
MDASGRSSATLGIPWIRLNKQRVSRRVPTDNGDYRVVGAPFLCGSPLSPPKVASGWTTICPKSAKTGILAATLGDDSRRFEEAGVGNNFAGFYAILSGKP